MRQLLLRVMLAIYLTYLGTYCLVNKDIIQSNCIEQFKALSLQYSEYGNYLTQLSEKSGSFIIIGNLFLILAGIMLIYEINDFVKCLVLISLLFKMVIELPVAQLYSTRLFILALIGGTFSIQS